MTTDERLHCGLRTETGENKRFRNCEMTKFADASGNRAATVNVGRRGVGEKPFEGFASTGPAAPSCCTVRYGRGRNTSISPGIANTRKTSQNRFSDHPTYLSPFQSGGQAYAKLPTRDSSRSVMAFG